MKMFVSKAFLDGRQKRKAIIKLFYMDLDQRPGTLKRRNVQL